MARFSQPFYGERPHSGALPSPEFETVKDVEADGINVQYYSVPTHIDAPLHFIEGGKSIDEFPLSKFAGDGVVLDVSVEEPREITMADVEAAEGEIREDDIVLLYTGWYEKYGTDAYNPHSWLAKEVLIAEHLANLKSFLDQRIDVVGFPIKIRDGDGAPARFAARGA